MMSLQSFLEDLIPPQPLVLISDNAKTHTHKKRQRERERGDPLESSTRSGLVFIDAAPQRPNRTAKCRWETPSSLAQNSLLTPKRCQSPVPPTKEMLFMEEAGKGDSNVASYSLEKLLSQSISVGDQMHLNATAAVRRSMSQTRRSIVPKTA